MWWLLIPPGASLVTHAARLLPTIPFAIDLPLVLHPSFGPPGCIGTPAAIAVSRGPTQVMHGPPYIFDPLLQASPFPPAERRYRALSIPFLSFSFLVVSRRAMRCSLFCSPCVARSPLALPRSSLFLSPSRRPVRTEMRRVHGARRTSSTCTTRCNACYCPSCYRYAIDQHATQPHHRVNASRGCSVLAARVSSDGSVTPGRVTTPPIDHSMSIRPSCRSG